MDVGMRMFRGWWQVAVALLGQAASAGAVFTAFSVVAVPLQDSFASNRTFVMLAISATVLVTGIVNPLAGAAMDRYRLRSLMLLGALLLVAGFVALSFTASMTQVIAVYALFMAVATVLLGPMASAALLSRWFTRRRGLAMGIAASGTALGGLIFPPLLQGLIDAFEWRVALRLFSATLFLTVVPAIFLLTIERPSDCNLLPDGDDAPDAIAERAQPKSAGSAIGVLRESNFWLIAIVIGLVFAGMTGLSTSMVPLVMAKGISAEHGALLLSIFSAGSFAGKMVFASVGDRVELRLVLVIALFLQTVAVFGFLRADTFVLLVIASASLGVAVGGILPLWSYLMAAVFGVDRIGRVMGLASSVVTVFNLAAPMLFGIVFDRTGSYGPALAGQIVLLLVAMALSLKIRIRRAAQAAAVSPA
jgi:MFS family permease